MKILFFLFLKSGIKQYIVFVNSFSSFRGLTMTNVAEKVVF